jgi:hypothetical protein
VSVRDGGAQALALERTAAESRNVGRYPRLIDEDEPFRVEVELPFEPVFAPLGDVGAGLLARVRGLFLKVSPQRARYSHSVERETVTLRSTASRSSNSLIVMSGVSPIRPSRYSR